MEKLTMCFLWLGVPWPGTTACNACTDSWGRKVYWSWCIYSMLLSSLKISMLLTWLLSSKFLLLLLFYPNLFWGRADYTNPLRCVPHFSPFPFFIYVWSSLLECKEETRITCSLDELSISVIIVTVYFRVIHHWLLHWSFQNQVG